MAARRSVRGGSRPYRRMHDQTGTLTALIDSARPIFGEDLDAGNVEVLVEMISGAHRSWRCCLAV